MSELSEFAHAGCTDEALYHLVRRGDLRAFDTLYKRYEVRLFGFLLRMVRNHHDAEDLFHETFLSLLSSREVTFDRASFATWLYRIGRNLSLNHLRKARRKAELPQKLEPAVALPVAEAALEDKERAAHLGKAVTELPAALAEVYRLRSTGLSYEEMATELDVPIGTVKSRMNQMTLRLHAQVHVKLHAGAGERE